MIAAICASGCGGPVRGRCYGSTDYLAISPVTLDGADPSIQTLIFVYCDQVTTSPILDSIRICGAKGSIPNTVSNLQLNEPNPIPVALRDDASISALTIKKIIPAVQYTGYDGFVANIVNIRRTLCQGQCKQSRDRTGNRYVCITCYVWISRRGEQSKTKLIGYGLKEWSEWGLWEIKESTGVERRYLVRDGYARTAA